MNKFKLLTLSLMSASALMAAGSLPALASTDHAEAAKEIRSGTRSLSEVGKRGSLLSVYQTAKAAYLRDNAGASEEEADAAAEAALADFVTKRSDAVRGAIAGDLGYTPTAYTSAVADPTVEEVKTALGLSATNPSIKIEKQSSGKLTVVAQEFKRGSDTRPGLNSANMVMDATTGKSTGKTITEYQTALDQLVAANEEADSTARSTHEREEGIKAAAKTQAEEVDAAVGRFTLDRALDEVRDPTEAATRVLASFTPAISVDGFSATEKKLIAGLEKATDARGLIQKMLDAVKVDEEEVVKAWLANPDNTGDAVYYSGDRLAEASDITGLLARIAGLEAALAAASKVAPAGGSSSRDLGGSGMGGKGSGGAADATNPGGTPSLGLASDLSRSGSSASVHGGDEEEADDTGSTSPTVVRSTVVDPKPSAPAPAPVDSAGAAEGKGRKLSKDGWTKIGGDRYRNPKTGEILPASDFA